MLGDLEMELLLSGKHDKDNAFLTIHAGTGGTEACDWARDALEAISEMVRERVECGDRGMPRT